MPARRTAALPTVLVIIEDKHNDGKRAESFINRTQAEEWIKIALIDDAGEMDMYNIDVNKPDALEVTFYTVSDVQVCDVKKTGIELIPRKKRK